MIKFEWNAIKINIQDSDISNFVSSIRYFCQKNAKSFDNPISTHLSGYWRNYQRSFSFGLKNQSHGLWKSNGESTYLFSTVKVNVFDAIPSYSPIIDKNCGPNRRCLHEFVLKKQWLDDALEMKYICII